MIDSDPQAEQAVLGALLSEPGVWEDVADLFRPELFPAHTEIAREIQALARENTPPDPVLVCQRLDARGAGIDHATVLEIAASVGSASNVRHYLVTLESLWALREAKNVARDMLTATAQASGEEVVARFAQRLSAIESKSAKPAQRLAEVMFKRLERREAIQKNPALLQAWGTGFGVLDSLTGGFVPGQLWTVAAVRATGKTAFMNSVLGSLAARGVPSGVFMLEDYGEALGDRSLMRIARIPSTMMRDTVKWGRETWTRAASAVDAAADWPIYVDDRHEQTIHDISASMRRMARQHGIRVFFLDNLSEVVVDAGARGEERFDQALGRVCKMFRNAAHSVGACAVVVAHLNRECEKAGRKPRISDIRNSDEIANASHVVVLLSREPESDVMLADVAKNRQGPPGEVTLAYDKEFMVVRDPGSRSVDIVRPPVVRTAEPQDDGEDND